MTIEDTPMYDNEGAEESCNEEPYTSLELGLYFGAMSLNIEGFSTAVPSTPAISPDMVWEVRWYSRYGEYSGQTQAEAKFFTTQDQAEAFAQRIRDAFVLLRYTTGAQVTVAASDDKARKILSGS